MNIEIIDRQADARAAFAAQAEEQTTELERQVNTIARAVKDAVADTRSLTIETIDAARFGEVAPINRIRILAPGGLRIAVAETAHDQFAEKLSIPKTYYRRMLETQPDLLATNMNRWLQTEPERRLLRMLDAITPEDAKALAEAEASLKLRAYLGASYRPLDNAELLTTVLPVMRKHGALLREFSLTDQRLHARFTRFEQSVEEIRARHAAKHNLTPEQAMRHAQVNGRDVSWVEEVIRLGAYLRNSETGFASLDVAGFMEILKCLNGMIVPAQVKVRHIGGKRSADENEMRFLSEQTQRLDNAAIFSRVRDALVASLDEDRSFEIAQTITTAKGEVLELPLPTFEFVGNVAKTLQLTEAETSVLQEETTHAMVQEQNEVGVRGLTKFAAVQGITALARRTEDFDRRTEFERTGWQFLSGKTAELIAAGKDHAKTARRN